MSTQGWRSHVNQRVTTGHTAGGRPRTLATTHAPRDPQPHVARSDGQVVVDQLCPVRRGISRPTQIPETTTRRWANQSTEEAGAA